ncbi:TPA: hypothetical protein HA265_06665, partial [Candidatus Woesearchaeota archaeon]|nr:hypothetical protein [Candidatus Woesearchaeota archaeon]
MASDKAKKIVKTKNLFLIAIIGFFIIMVLPTFIRYYSGNHTLIGAEAYQHIGAASVLMKTGSINMFNPPENAKELVYATRTYSFSPYHYLLAYSGKIISLQAASRIVPLILGLLSLLIFNILLKTFVDEAYKRNIMLLLLLVNPAFIYTFTVSNPHAAAIFFSLLGIMFFTREKAYNIVLAAACFAIVSLFGLFNLLLAAFVLLAYVLIAKKLNSRLMITSFLLAVFFFWKKTVFYQSYTYAPQMNILGNLISDLGGLTGFGIFTIMLAFYGIYSQWHKKEKFLTFFLVAILLAASLFYVGNMVNAYLAFFVAIAAGAGMVNLLNANWDVRVIKNLTILIILCGLLFSTVSYMTREVSMPPTQELVNALEWMRTNTFKDGTVLTHYENGYLVSALAKNTVLADSFLTSRYNQKFVYKTEESMFY